MKQEETGIHGTGHLQTIMHRIGGNRGKIGGNDDRFHDRLIEY